MKIFIEKVFDGEHRITILPRRGAQMAPLQVWGSDQAVVREELLTAIVAVADRERTPVLALL